MVCLVPQVLAPFAHFLLLTYNALDQLMSGLTEVLYSRLSPGEGVGCRVKSEVCRAQGAGHYDLSWSRKMNEAMDEMVLTGCT